jgi:hypothetical protein
MSIADVTQLGWVVALPDTLVGRGSSNQILLAPKGCILASDGDSDCIGGLHSLD